MVWSGNGQVPRHRPAAHRRSRTHVL